MSDYNYLPASNGSGDTPLIHLTAARSVSSTVFAVDTVTNVPANFIATCGTLLPSGFIDTSTKTDFKGHVSGSTLVIDGFEPGTTDVGNAATQVIVIKPTTGWANRVAQFIKNATGFGTPENVTFAGITGSSISNSGNYTQTGGSFSIPNGSLSTRALTNPAAFQAIRTTDFTTPGAGWADIVCDSALYNPGSHYNVANGKFTAPFAGLYHFDAAAQDNAPWAHIAIGLWVNEAEYSHGDQYQNATGNAANGANFAGPVGLQVNDTIYLAAGDVIYPRIFTDDSDGIGGSSTVHVTRFSGFLVSV